MGLVGLFRSFPCVHPQCLSSEQRHTAPPRVVPLDQLGSNSFIKGANRSSKGNCCTTSGIENEGLTWLNHPTTNHQ